MIVTVTLNPAVDKVLEVPGFHVGAHVRASVASLLPAGKGVNVARGLVRLGGGFLYLDFSRLCSMFVARPICHFRNRIGESQYPCCGQMSLIRQPNERAAKLDKETGC